jgi:hypothetical protein
MQFADLFTSQRGKPQTQVYLQGLATIQVTLAKQAAVQHPNFTPGLQLTQEVGNVSQLLYTTG